MSNHHHILIFDPVPFADGNKQITHQVLEVMNPEANRITVLTANALAWQDIPNVELAKMSAPNWLSNRSRGIGYWLTQCYFCLMLLWARICYGRIDSAVAAATPIVDMPLYLMHWMLRYEIIQMIHAPVGWSRAIGYCLTHADKVFYPPSAHQSMLEAIACLWNKAPNNQAHHQANVEMARDKYTPFDRKVEAHLRLVSAFSHCQNMNSLLKH